MKKTNINLLAQLAIITALSIILGIYVQIKTPTGFLTLLDAGIYFSAFYFGKKEGAIVGVLSGFLIDLILGYPQWMFISLLAHGGQGYFATWHKNKVLSLSVASLVMVGTYFLFSIFFYNLGEALAGVLGNVMQNFVGMAVGYFLARILKKRVG